MTGFVSCAAEISKVRATDPERIITLLRERKCPPLHTGDGRLMIVACDHPARGALAVGSRAGAMNDRLDLLDRLVTALARPGVDGLLTTADIAEDLQQFLDEVAATGYEWIELGPYGYLPTDPAQLTDELGRRNLRVTAGTVFESLHQENSWEAVSKQVSDVALLAKAVGAEYVVVIPSMWRDDVTGEVHEPGELDADGWRRKIDGNNRLGKLILEEYGLRVAYHPHADSHVDNNQRVQRFLQGTDPAFVNLCLDTGHLTYCGGDSLALIEAEPDRIIYTHLKQVDPAIKARVDEENLTWSAAVQLGVMCEPPGGVPAMPEVFAALEGLDRPIFGIVEQDMYGCPTDIPAPIARRTLTYLRGCRHAAPR